MPESPYEDPNDPRYDELLAAMDRLAERSQAEAAEARGRFATKREAWEHQNDELRSSIDRFSSILSGVKGGVPDVRADGGAQPPPDAGLDGELAESEKWRAEGDRHRDAAMDAARLPPLLPRARPVVRNAIVYGATMIVCGVVQFILRGGMDDGWLPDDAWLWVGLLLPVLFLFIGYLATGLIGRPKLPTVDERGRQIPFTVHRSPRLGVAMAVATMTVYLVT